jgi:hypothetical protein
VTKEQFIDIIVPGQNGGQFKKPESGGSLGSSLKHDPATELVAKFMVELAQTGVHDYEPLLAATLERFGHRVTQQTPRS